MVNTILFLLLIVSAIIIWHLFVTRSKNTPLSPRTKQKQENKERVLTLFQNKNEIFNNDVERLLGVSDSTATRYLDELEKEGKIIQVGKTGQSVRYVRS